MSREEPLVYTVYGFGSQNHTTQTLLGFNGEPVQTLPSLYLLGSGYRGYRTDLMRFVSPDSLSPFGNGGINAYSYCKGDPVGRIDPSGHVPLIFKPFVSFKKGIQNRFFGRTPKKDRPVTSTLQGTTGDERAPHGQANDDLGRFMVKRMARNEISQLTSANKELIESAKLYDLTTVDPELINSKLEQLKNRKNRIEYLQSEYNIPIVQRYLKVTNNILELQKTSANVKAIRGAILY
ncbi:RHS repeat-associated core domain-containing protein [Pantoea sp. Tr-811]|uniref:RHS repeat-associated core domain-containing protein n=1 Tax=Pantoea sp. Tr-811 TaxID=2608361 RepID=UPI00142043EA|nr:RHS repeat-associated core domain-containing protein [Pantoea sp. Tr-811]NIF26274.1 RHS repeat-associated core domain-containing protein [Pantoea sp. Tr-811]